MRHLNKLIFAILLFVFTSSTTSASLDSISFPSLIRGINYPERLSIYGNGLDSSTHYYRVFGIYLLKSDQQNLHISLKDSLSTQVDWDSYTDSIVLYNGNYIPVSADTGVYDLLLIRADRLMSPTVYFYDTLYNAVTISTADLKLGGKLYIDINFNKVFDAGDSLITANNWGVALSGHSNSIQFDSLGNYFFYAMANTQYQMSAPFPSFHYYAMSTDSLFYNPLTTTVDITDLDFGVKDIIYLCDPDTVYMNDTVTIDLYSWDLFSHNSSEIQFRDSTGNIAITVSSSSPEVILFDIDHITIRTIISTPTTGWHDIIYNEGFQAEYYKLDGLYVLPPTTTSIEKVYGKEISVFPNPANDFIKIEMKSVSSMTIVIYDLLGIIVAEKHLNDDTEIVVAGLAPGIYFLKTNQGDTIRFVKN
jgi:hypothetical protein